MIRRDWTVIGCVALVAVATVTASFTAQAGLGELAGWTTKLHLFGVEVAMSWLLPVTVDAYGIAATRIATDRARYNAEVRGQAFGHSIAAVVVSVLGNAMFHLLEAEVIELGGASWVLVVAVSVVPPVALGGLAHLLGVAARGEIGVVDPGDELVVDEVLVHHVDPGTAGKDLPRICGSFVPAIPVPRPALMPVLTPAPDELFPVAANRYADEVATGVVPTLTRIKREMKVGQPRAALIRAYLGQLAGVASGVRA